MQSFKSATFEDSHIECTEGVSTSNLAIDEEIGFSQIGSTLPNSSGPISHTINSNLSCLINTDSVEIESLEGNTRELDEPLHDAGLPFSKTILDRGELGKLTFPIGMDTERFEISVLIEIRSFTPIRWHGGLGIRNDGTLFGVERREHARCVPGIVDLNQFDRQ